VERFPTSVRLREWLGEISLFWAWGFVMHGVGLLLHEIGGHAAAAIVFGCGIRGIDLTYFGHGVVHYAPCDRWTWSTLIVADWSGLALTIGAGVGTMALQRRAGLAPLARLLLALLATAFLLGQLSYATSGGFHDLYDPERTARALSNHGLHVVAWLPTLVLFGVSALFGASAVTDAFREHFRSRSRLHGLVQLATTLGVSGLLYFVAFRIEWSIRTDLWMRGVAYQATQVAVARHELPPFPIERVLFGLATLAFVAALARPVRGSSSREERRPIPRRLIVIVAALAASCSVAIFALPRV
jgi:hypothetical protein